MTKIYKLTSSLLSAVERNEALFKSTWHKRILSKESSGALE